MRGRRDYASIFLFLEDRPYSLGALDHIASEWERDHETRESKLIYLVRSSLSNHEYNFKIK